jgi:HSP20 family protein
MDLMLRYYPVATAAGWPARSGVERAFERGFFDRAGGELGPAGQAERGFAGANLYESPEAYLIELPLPGVKAEDVALTVQADRLTLKARRHWAAPPDAQPLARGFGAGELQQTVTLPGDVTTGELQAELRDGILRLELPKAASARPRTIPVNGPVRGAPSAVGLPAQGGAATANGAAPPGAGR